MILMIKMFINWKIHTDLAHFDNLMFTNGMYFTVLKSVVMPYLKKCL